MTPLVVFIVLLVGYALFYAASRGGHNEWYQKGYDEGMKTPFLSSDANLAASACTGAVFSDMDIGERASSSHEDDVQRGCHDAIQDRLDKRGSDSP
jgi:hypothetical protein